MQVQCDTCGCVGNEDDYAFPDEECPDEECEGTCQRTLDGTFEVTVPVVVRILDGNITHIRIDEGFGGFFSEAEDAGGVWDEDADEWSAHERLSLAAAEVVKAVLRCGAGAYDVR